MVTVSVSSPTGLGDSNIKLGGGSMTGVVQTNTEVGKVWGMEGEEWSSEAAGFESSSLAREGAMSFISVRAQSVSALMESRTIAGVSSASAKSGSVTDGGLCKGLEDSRCSLLTCMPPSLAMAVIRVGDEDETEQPLGSLGSGSPGYTSMNIVTGASPGNPAVKSTPEEAVEPMVDTAVAAASWSGVSCTRV